MPDLPPAPATEGPTPSKEDYRQATLMAQDTDNLQMAPFPVPVAIWMAYTLVPKHLNAGDIFQRPFKLGHFDQLVS